MGCCSNHNETSKKNEDGAGIKDSANNRFVETKQLKGGGIKMNKRMVLWIAIGILFLAVLFLTYKVSSLTGNAAAGSSGKLDTTGWTENEIMNYEMHGTIPARIGSSASTSNSGGMVGGC